jgi:uncharacterized RDD family membrane protein YckC
MGPKALTESLVARRAGSHAVDSAIVVGGAWLLFRPLEHMARMHLPGTAVVSPLLFAVSVTASLGALHFLVSRTHLSGKTPGKSLFRLLTVQRSTGGRISAWAAYKRDLFGKFLATPLLPLLALPKLKSPEAPWLHDWVSGTRVVSVPPARNHSADLTQAWLAALLSGAFLLIAYLQLDSRMGTSRPAEPAAQAPTSPAGAAPREPVTAPSAAASAPSPLIRCGDPGVQVFDHFVLVDRPGHRLELARTCIRFLAAFSPALHCVLPEGSGPASVDAAFDDVEEIVDRCHFVDQKTSMQSWAKLRCQEGEHVALRGRDFCGQIGPAAP